MAYRVKNWERFQRYKNRTPPWIKLHRDLLGDPEYFSLSGDEAKYLVLLWLLASESIDGSLPSTEKMTFRLRITETKLMSILAGLSHWVVHDVCNTCADDVHEAFAEGEGEGEGETEYIGGDGEPDPKDRENWKALFAYWQEIHDHPRAMFTKEKESKLRARLREGFSLEDLASAIRGIKNSKFHMGDNDQGKVWDGWTLILRNAEQVEKFMELDK